MDLVEDEEPVEDDVEDIADSGDEHGDEGVAEALEELLAETEEHERYESDETRDVVRFGSCGDGGVLAHAEEEGNGRSEEGTAEEDKQPGEPPAGAQQA